MQRLFPTRAVVSLAIALQIAPCLAQTNPVAQGAAQQSPEKPAAPSPAPESARKLNGEAEQLMARSQFAAARAAFERAIELARAQKDPGAEAYALRGIGLTYERRGDYKEAIPYLQRALAVSEAAQDELGRAYAHNFLFASYSQVGEREKAMASGRLALEYFKKTGNLRAEGYLLRNLAFGAEDGPELWAMQSRALEIAQKIGDNRLRAIILHQQADNLVETGEFAKASPILAEAISLLEKGDSATFANALTSMGRLLRLHGQPELALGYYERALKIQSAADDRLGITQTYNAMGVAYGAMDEKVRAGEYFQKALDLATAAGTERLIDSLTGALAANYADRGELPRSARLLEEVIQRGKDPAMDYRHHQLAAVYGDLSRTSEALASIEKALELRLRSKSGELYNSLLARGLLLADAGRAQDGIADVQEAMRLLEEQRGNAMPADLFKQGFGERMQRTYSAAVNLLNKTGRVREAMETAELARSRAFLDLLATREVSLHARDNAALDELRQVGASLRQQGVDPGQAAFDAGALLTTRGAAPPAPDARLRGRWEKADPELRSFVAAEAFSADQMAATAKRLNSTVISYWVGENETSVWVVTGDGTVRSARAKVTRNRLTQLIRSATGDSHGFAVRGEGSADAGNDTASITTRGAAALRLNPAAKQAWRDLHDALFLPVRAMLPQRSGSRLTIIPHGPLFRLSFAALQDARGRYLVEDYEIHYAPAGAVLDFTQKKVARAARADTRGYLLIADPTGMPPDALDRKLSPLPGARAEVQSIAQMLPAGRATTFSSAAALESRVREGASGKRVLHFATHGIVRDDAPLDSFLALGAGAAGEAGNAAASDGRLTAQEIYSLDLDAQLVFLSACRSGLGKVSGDGVVGLTRAFIYGGTPSVVATLWDVADEPATLLVPEFYRSYVRRSAAGPALRAAQLRLLADLRAGRVKISTAAGSFTLPEHPALWAPFVLIGEP